MAGATKTGPRKNRATNGQVIRPKRRPAKAVPKERKERASRQDVIEAAVNPPKTRPNVKKLRMSAGVNPGAAHVMAGGTRVGGGGNFRQKTRKPPLN